MALPRPGTGGPTPTQSAGVVHSDLAQSPMTSGVNRNKLEVSPITWLYVHATRNGTIYEHINPPSKAAGHSRTLDARCEIMRNPFIL